VTLQQGAALERRLKQDDLAMPVVVGMRNWHPFIADAVRELAGRGARSILGIPLAPQFSTLSVQKYIDAAQRALPAGVTFSCVRTFHDHPALIEAFAERVRAASPQGDEEVVFTAHSLPDRVVRDGDPYPTEVMATAARVAAASGIRSYQTAYQSAGRTPEPWLRPDLSDKIRERARAGTRRFLIVPIGFVSDHTEILFDIDVQAAATAGECGATLRRIESLNTSPTFIAALASLVRTEFDKLQ
jgi:ferrochelatase